MFPQPTNGEIVMIECFLGGGLRRDYRVYKQYKSYSLSISKSEALFKWGRKSASSHTYGKRKILAKEQFVEKYQHLNVWSGNKLFMQTGVPMSLSNREKIVEVLIVSGSGQNQMKLLDNFPQPSTHKNILLRFMMGRY